MTSFVFSQDTFLSKFFLAILTLKFAAISTVVLGSSRHVVVFQVAVAFQLAVRAKRAAARWRWTKKGLIERTKRPVVVQMSLTLGRVTAGNALNAIFAFVTPSMQFQRVSIHELHLAFPARKRSIHRRVLLLDVDFQVGLSAARRRAIFALINGFIVRVDELVSLERIALGETLGADVAYVRLFT